MIGKSTILICCLAANGFTDLELGYVNLGPMLHVNFSPQATRTSYAFEISAWWLEAGKYDDIGFPSHRYAGYGLDLGLEYDRRVFRMYSEPQFEKNFTGISAGPVVEFGDGHRARWGMQASVYAFYLPLIDLRYRRLNGTNVFAPGLSLKYPVPTYQLH